MWPKSSKVKTSNWVGWLSIVLVLFGSSSGILEFAQGPNPTDMGPEIDSLRLLRAQRALSKSKTRLLTTRINFQAKIEARDMRAGKAALQSLTDLDLMTSDRNHYRALWLKNTIALPGHAAAIRKECAEQIARLAIERKDIADHLGGYHFIWKHQDLILHSPIEIEPNKPYTITWTTALAFDFMDIEYFDGESWRLVAEGEVNDGKFEWVAPSEFTTNARLWIKGWGPNGNVEAYSKFFMVREK